MTLLEIAEKIIGYALPFALIVMQGAVLTAKSGFYQIFCFKKSFKYVFCELKSSEAKRISPFKSAMTSLSSTVGTGNIAGVACAVAIGGAGAVFWMWVTAFLGMCVKSAEILLTVRYSDSKRDNGAFNYIKKGFGKKIPFAAKMFAFFCVAAAFFSGAAAQTNAVTAVCGQNGKFALGLTVAAAALFALIGGVKFINDFNSAVAPFMMAGYILLCLFVIGNNINSLPRAFSMIVSGALNPRSVTGGAVSGFATALFTGAARGVFSNEAGLGTAALAHGVCNTKKDPSRAFFGIFEVFTDTVLICTLTALTILCAGVNIEYGKYASSELVFSALLRYGRLPASALTVTVFFFGISSVAGWGMYGKISAEYLAGEKGKKIFTFAFPIFCLAGVIINTGAVWRLSAVFNGIMLCVNMCAVISLTGDGADGLKKLKRKEIK